MVYLGLDGVIHYQFGDLFKKYCLWQLELRRSGLERERFVLGGAVDQEDLESCFFESEEESFSERAILEIFHSSEDFDLTDVVEGFSPLTLVELAGCEDDVVTAVLGNKLHAFHVVLLNQLSEVSANDGLADIESVLADVWNLE